MVDEKRLPVVTKSSGYVSRYTEKRNVSYDRNVLRIKALWNLRRFIPRRLK